MKIQSCSVSAETLKGAVLSDNDGTEMGIIVDISFNLNRHEVTVWIRQANNGTTGISWDSMKEWRISFQPASLTDNVDTIVGKISEAVEYIVEENSNH
jgi:sporulation protein YlmC with PRC-barrel domain